MIAGILFVEMVADKLSPTFGNKNKSVTIARAEALLGTDLGTDPIIPQNVTDALTQQLLIIYQPINVNVRPINTIIIIREPERAVTNAPQRHLITTTMIVHVIYALNNIMINLYMENNIKQPDQHALAEIILYQAQTPIFGDVNIDVPSGRNGGTDSVTYDVALPKGGTMP